VIWLLALVYLLVGLLVLYLRNVLVNVTSVPLVSDVSDLVIQVVGVTRIVLLMWMVVQSVQIQLAKNLPDVQLFVSPIRIVLTTKMGVPNV